MSHDGVGLRAVMRSVAFLTAGVLAVPLLAGCSEEDQASKPLAGPDVAPAAPARMADGGTLRWAVDTVPETLNAFQTDADETTTRVAQAVLPAMYRMDANGRPVRVSDFLESAEVADTEPRQVVVYHLNPKAVWSDGRAVGVQDFEAQWHALSGKDTAYWTAHNLGYDRIEKVERGGNDHEVKVTFQRPYSDWQSLFSPLYPKDVMGSPESFNEGARTSLKVTSGPFTLKKVDRRAGTVTLARGPRWWGSRAHLDQIALIAVPRDKRADALAAGRLDLADVDAALAGRITDASRASGGKDGKQAKQADGAKGAKDAKQAKDAEQAKGAKSSEDEKHEAKKDDGAEDSKHGKGAKDDARGKRHASRHAQAKEKQTLGVFVVRKSLEPAYTQLALNGSTGPLADERVRKAVARAIDRAEIARLVLGPLGLPADPVGSHLALSGQAGYADGSDALGGHDTSEAKDLLSEAGWKEGGPVKEKPEKAAGPEHDKSKNGNTGEARTAKAEKDEAKKGKGKASKRSEDGDETDESDEGSEGSEGSENEEQENRSDESGQSDDTDRGDGGDSAGDGQDEESDDATYFMGQDDRTEAGTHDDKARHNKARHNKTRHGKAHNGKTRHHKAGHHKADDDKPGTSRANRPLPHGPGALLRPLDPRGSVADVRDQPLGPVAPKGPVSPKRTAAPAAAGVKTFAKNGKPLSLRLVLPTGPGADSLRTAGERIARMLGDVGIRTEITKVSADSYFRDHVVTGQYDLALYSWPASAFPATDARPIYAKPVPGADGSLRVEQNYTRVGTDQVDQLFDQAVSTLDEDESRSLIRKADARIWAVAGSIPLYQRPQLVAARKNLANAGAWSFQTPVYQDMGFLKKS